MDVDDRGMVIVGRYRDDQQRVENEHGRSERESCKCECDGDANVPALFFQLRDVTDLAKVSARFEVNT